MAALNDDVKRFIVRALACFDTPSQVVEAVKQEYRISVSRQQVECYDPGKHQGRNLHAKWKALFKQCRENFIEDSSEIGISHKSVRLRALARMAAKAEDGRNIALAVQIIEQAAKEVGGMYESRRLDPPKTPGADEHVPAPEYTLKPDEDVPAKPIL